MQIRKIFGIVAFKQVFTLRCDKLFAGSAAVVIFDREVNIGSLIECEDILAAETLKALDGSDYLRCRWATKHQLVVFLPKREKSKVHSKPNSSDRADYCTRKNV